LMSSRLTIFLLIVFVQKQAQTVVVHFVRL